ncbi:MAG: phosphatase [Oscillospiraceae bacterium]
MKIIADTHTHTIASTHAYSTILENAKFASENGIEYLAMTDHAPSMWDAPHIWHFGNMNVIPDYLYGVRILRGVEVNILPQGKLDLTNDDLSRLEWVVASIHSPVYPETSIEENTNAYITAAKNPHVDVIGHSGSIGFMYDYEKAIKAFGEYNKLVEINHHTFEARADGVKNCVEIAKLCKKYNVRVVANSDAHFAYAIGKVDNALNILHEIEFPKELIINSERDLFEAYLAERKTRIR